MQKAINVTWKNDTHDKKELRTNETNQVMIAGFKTPAIKRFEDIHADEPYIDSWVSGDVAYIDVFYVPPVMRGKGEGKKLFNEWISTLDTNVKRIKLKACTLGGMEGVTFWGGLGFIQAYAGAGAEQHELKDTMTMGVNGYSNPVPEHIAKLYPDSDRHWIECNEDQEHLKLNPQTQIKK